MINKTMTYDTRLILTIYRIGCYLNLRKKNIFLLPFYILNKLIYRLLEIIYGFSLPFSTKIGKNVCFKHGLYGVFISSKAIIGDNVIIMHQVTIGSNFGSDKDIVAPTIGNDVFIGPGAKIIGSVIIHDHSKIGANALLTNQICEQGIYITRRSEKI